MPSPACEAVITSAIARIEAMGAESRRIKSLIDADSRIIWLRAQSSALWQPTESADDLMAQLAEGRIARQRRVMELIRARRAQFNNFPSAVRKHLREAAVCRRQSPRPEAMTVRDVVGVAA